MKKLLSIVGLLTAFSLQTLGQTKAQTVQNIRKQYAEAKKKIDQNGKNGQSPKDLRIVLNRLEDEEIWLYDMEAITYYFDEQAAEGSVVTKHPYFITEQWSNH